MCGKDDRDGGKPDLYDYGRDTMRQGRRDTRDQPLRGSWWDRLSGGPDDGDDRR